VHQYVCIKLLLYCLVLLNAFVVLFHVPVVLILYLSEDVYVRL